MCNFFSSVSNGEGRVWFFDAKQRKNRVKMPDGSRIKFYDSHTSIANYYGFTGEKEDCLNKWEYNPYTDQLVLDTQNTADDQEDVLAAMHKIDWNTFGANVKKIRELIDEIKSMKLMDNHGQLPDGVRLFETRTDAYRATVFQEKDTASFYARKATDRGNDASCCAWDTVWDIASFSRVLVGDWFSAAWDVALMASLYACEEWIDQKHLDYAKLRWSVWQAGYGVFADVDGVIYAYKKITMANI